MKMDSNHIYINAPYHEQQRMKNVGGVWSKKEMAWRFPKSTFALQELEQAFPKLGTLDAFKTIKEQLTDKRNKLKQLKERTDTTSVANDALRPYQRQDANYLAKIPNAGIFNQPRTGKTPTAIETIKARQTKKNIIICPASLQYNWKSEINKWHPEASVYLYAGTPKQREQALNDFHANEAGVRYLIVSKDTAKRDLQSLTFSHDVCVVDEAHYLRNDDTAQTKAVYTIGYQAKHRYALTGTPTVKHPADVFGILKFLYPHKWTSKWQFYERYFEIDDNGFGKSVGKPIAHRTEELQDLIDAISTQRLRKDVMQWLPDKQRHTHVCHMDTKQSKAYQSMLEDFFVKHGDIEVDTQNVLAQLTRLRQITLDPYLLDLPIASAKTDALIEAIEDNVYAQSGEPIVIMSMFTSYLNLLKPMIASLGKRVGMITGEMSNKDKNDTAQAFQQGHLDILLCNIISAGTGFTLDRGEVIIFTDKAWNPSDNEQAEDRITPTQKDRNHKHFIVSLVCEGTVDERIEQLLNRKESLTAIVNQCKTVDQFRLLLL